MEHTKLIVGMVFGLSLVIGMFYLRKGPNGAVEGGASNEVEVTSVQTKAKRNTNKAHPMLAEAPAPANTETNSAEFVPVSKEVVDLYLKQNKTNAASLLAAFQATRDRAYLKMAAEAFPNDPNVLSQVVSYQVFPGQEREWLEKFKAAAPDNALSSYCSANDYFKKKQPELALQELADGIAKPKFQDYLREKVQDLEEVYLLSGKSPSEAKGAAAWNLMMPHLREVREMSKEMAVLQQQYLAEGDKAAAETMASFGMILADQVTTGGFDVLINRLVAGSVEKELLKNLDPAQPLAGFSGTVQDRLNTIAQEREGYNKGAALWERWNQTASETDKISFYDRLKLYGEPAAISWLQNRV